MRILYINNFRGFQNTIIPIQKVNFLVGENSTGKTSILKLIKIISDETFKYSLDFISPVVDLGRFEDIVNKTESSGNFFEIGMMIQGNDTLRMKRLGFDSTKVNFIKIKYKEVNEKITVTELSILTQYFEAFIIYREEKYQFVYKIFKNVEKVDNEKIAQQFFEWCKVPSSLSKRKIFRKLNNEDFYLDNSFYKENIKFTLQDIFEVIGHELRNKQEKEESPNRWRHQMLFATIDSFFPKIKWIAPIRAEPKRIYEHKEIKESIDGSHAPQALRDILGTASKININFKTFIDNFGKNSHLFDEIKVKKFGTEKFAPFEIQVVLEGKPYSISNVGYGVSQVLPLLLEVFDEKNKWLAIQQPEVHLHPRAQAEFGEIIFNSAHETEKVFFIETHSDFTLDRFRHCISTKESNIDSQVLYFNRKNKLNSLEIIPIATDGSYWENCSAEFREFFINESIKLLGI